MAESIQLQSDQYLAPFQQAANQAQYQAGAQTPQAALGAFLQVRQQRMQEAQNAAHVALEHAQLQDYQQRIGTYQQEFQTRQLLAQTQMQEMQVRKAREEMETSLEPFKGTGAHLGEVIQTGPNEHSVWTPNRQGKPTMRDATDEEVAQHKETQRTALETQKALAYQRYGHGDYFEEGHYGTNRAAMAAAKPSAPNPIVIEGLSSPGWRANGLTSNARKTLADLESQYGGSAVQSYLSTLVNAGMRLPKTKGLDEKQIMASLVENLASDPTARSEAETVLKTMARK